MARDPESLVREVLAQHLQISFAESRSHLGQWGRTDGEAMLGANTRLLLEVESKQKHPSTNVLKIWPFLEEHEGLSILLVHVFFPDSLGRESSRGQLAFWLANRLQQLLGPRFVYRRIMISRDGELLEGFPELKDAVSRVVGDGQKSLQEPA